MKLEHIKSNIKKNEIFLYFPSKNEISSVKSFKDLDWVGELSKHGDIYIITDYPSDTSRVIPFIKEVIEFIKERGIRWVYVIGNSQGSLYSQSFAVLSGKVLKRMALINPISRSEPGLFKRMLECLEDIIPCGLPLRKQDNRYDSRSELHSIHAPSIIFGTTDMSEFEEKEFNFFKARLPNVWSCRMTDSLNNKQTMVNKVVKEVISFSKVPAKYPQKNL